MTTEPVSREDSGLRFFVLLASFGFLALTALRLFTLARDTWEWDEILFVQAARNGFDVRVNHPHPPGYPLFVLPARLLVLLGASPFGATLGVAVVSGLVAVVLVGVLARELGAGREEALFAGLLWALIPSVWLHSVRPLSDSAGAAAFLLAVLLLVRAAKEPDGKVLVWAAIAVGASAGVRPQVAVALLPLAAVVGVCAMKTRRGRSRVAWAVPAGLAAGVLPYVPVIVGSGGLREYLAAARGLAEFVRRFDAPPLHELATAALWERWLVDPFGGFVPALAIWLAAAGIVTAPRALRFVGLAFLPLLLFSVATLNPVTAPRYGIALLAAAPLSASFGLTWLRARWRLTAAVLATGLLSVVAFPAVRPVVEVSSRPSPAVAAMAALRGDPKLVGRNLLLDPALRVHEMELGGAVPWQELAAGRPVVAPAGTLVVTNDRDLPGFRPLRVFRFRSAALELISRGRYRSVTIWEPIAVPSAVARFKATDLDLLSSVDDPSEGAVVHPPLRIRGWCQERGGGVVVPEEVRIDGVAVVPERFERTARPDVSAAIPQVGDASRAGYEIVLPAGAVSPGKHVLEVVFETKDRQRVYPARRFTLAAPGAATPGSS